MIHCFILAPCEWGSGSIPSFCFHRNKGMKKRRGMKAIMHANEQGQGQAITIKRACVWRNESRRWRIRGWGYYKKDERVKRKGKMILNEGTRDSVITQSTTGWRERELEKNWKDHNEIDKRNRISESFLRLGHVLAEKNNCVAHCKSCKQQYITSSSIQMCTCTNG